ncbi:MAG: hypothetical protein WDZ80_02650 [Candidatus Paceibacterota bacterium]
MERLSIKTGSLKFVLGWLLIVLIRLIPFRPPNFQPMMATMMPFSKRYSVVSIFLFGFFTMVVVDFFMSNLGVWTLFTATVFGFLGVWSYFYFQKRLGKVKNYVKFSIYGTLFYDIVTGLSIGPLFFNQPLWSAITGQIVFTLWHLAGNIVFAIILSPLIEKWLVSNETLEISLFKEKKYI